MDTGATGTNPEIRSAIGEKRVTRALFARPVAHLPWRFSRRGSEKVPDMEGDTRTGLAGEHSARRAASKNAALSPEKAPVSP